MYMSLQPYFLHDTQCYAPVNKVRTHYTTDDGPTRAETHLVMVIVMKIGRKNLNRKIFRLTSLVVMKISRKNLNRKIFRLTSLPLQCILMNMSNSSQITIKRRDPVVSTPVSYSWGPGLKSQPGDQLPWLRFSLFFSVTTGECWDSALEHLPTNVSFQALSNSSFTYHHPPIRRCIVLVTEATSWNKLQSRITFTSNSSLTFMNLKQKLFQNTSWRRLDGEEVYSSYSFSTSALDGSEWSASRRGRALPRAKDPPVPIAQDAEWAPEPVWKQRLEEKSFASVGDRTLLAPSSNP
jgi:hypothetical protein